MDRKGIIAIVLSLAVLVWWQLKSQREFRDWQSQNRQTAQQQAADGTPTPGGVATPSPGQGTNAGSPAASSSPAAAEPEAAPDLPEEKLVVATPWVEYTFTNHGGGIASVKLLRHEGTNASERMVLNPFDRHPIGAIFDNPNATARSGVYTLSRRSANVVVAEQTTPAGVTITKTYTLPDGEETKGAKEYAVALEVTYSNPTGAPFEKADHYLYAGAIGPIREKELPYYTGLTWQHDHDVKSADVNWFNASRIPLVGIERSPAKSEYLEAPGKVEWLGIRNQYFTTVVSGVDFQARGVWGRRFPVKIGETELHGIEAALALPSLRVAAGESLTQHYVVYAGPKEYRRLKQLGNGEEAMMNFGVFKLISIFLLGAMNWLQGYLHSYALSIIVLTFIVRGVLWPIQGKANTSMKRMQLLQPKAAELREKLKDDPTRMNQEVMKLYKEYSINPFAGCLPMLIQIPIFFGFYSMLGTAVELRNSQFLWVSDLSQPDTVAHFLGFPINVLPLLMAATMVLQMKLTPKSGDPMQQRIFMFMPLIFVVFTYNFASALALYYAMQNVLSIIQLYVTRNEPMPALVKKEAPKKPSKGGAKKRKTF
ncbi:MAG TPA: membrane protein insertase YidC [Chthoniobacteraceae bacterium]|nr:membrane protein insertase YidC [Chthoniobacteraceae bacterium]